MALILIGIGVVIGLAICRRRTSSPVKDGPDDFTTPTYVSAQRVEPRIRYSGDSRRSQRTSLYVEENRNGKMVSYAITFYLRSRFNARTLQLLRNIYPVALSRLRVRIRTNS